MATELEVPRTLPVAHLSVSSIKTYLDCSLAWYRKYVLREYEPPNGPMILGSSVGAAEGHAHQEQIDTGQRPGVDDVLDLFSDELDERIAREEIDWRDDTPGSLKDAGIGAVQAYESTVAPLVHPVSVEREFQLSFEGVEWNVTGYLDLEEEDGAVCDLKVKGRKLNPAEARTDIQPTTYLLARRAEGVPAPEFRYHTMVRTKTPYAEIIPTTRTDGQLDALADRLLLIASEIDWRLEHDVWQGAVPGSWRCSEKFCGYWPTCKFGGLR